MQAAGWARSLILGFTCLSAPLWGAAAPEAGDGAIPTRQQLIGAWRLVSIDFSGPQGPIHDPFYQADSTGIIVYDSSGWMSVQIAAPHRQAFEVPATRRAAATGRSSQRKASAFDTYYSYYGTWDLDEARGVVTHNVKSSLIPAETGLSYSQAITLDGGRLTFTVRDLSKGRETVRRKVWERLTGTH